jgi:hypothetical protein
MAMGLAPAMREPTDAGAVFSPKSKKPLLAAKPERPRKARAGSLSRRGRRPLRSVNQAIGPSTARPKQKRKTRLVKRGKLVATTLLATKPPPQRTAVAPMRR